MGEPTRILLVDDEAAVLRSLARFLDDCGLEVATAASGEEALAQAATGRHDVAIVDLRLGGMDGTEVIRAARRLAPRLRFLIFTGSLDFRLTPELESQGIGPEDVLYKPLRSLEQVTAAVERLVAATPDS